MNDFFYQEGEIPWFKEYINQVWNKWDPLGIPPQVSRDLKNYKKTLEEFLARLIDLSISLGFVGKDEGVEKCKNQLTQLVCASYYLGLEHNKNVPNHIEPHPRIKHPAIELIRLPMIELVESLLSGLKKDNRLSQSEIDKFSTYSIQVITDTANQCYEKGILTTATEISDRMREMKDHVSQILPYIYNYNDLMINLRDLMNQRPTLFGRKKWESEVLIVLGKLYTTAKKLPNQNKHGEMGGIWYNLDQICKETGLMLENFKAGMEGRDPNGTTKANLNKNNITYHFKLFDKAIRELVDTPSVIFYAFTHKWFS